MHTRIHDPVTEAGAVIVLDFHRDTWNLAGRFVPHEIKAPEEHAVEVAATIARYLCDGGWKVGLFSNGRDPLGVPGWSIAQLKAGESLGEALNNARGRQRDERLEPLSIAAKAGEDQFSLIHENLGRIELSDGLRIEEVLPLELAHVPRDQTLIVVTGDITDDFVEGMAKARHLGYRVMLMIVNNPAAHDKAFEVLLPYGVEVYRMDEDWRLKEIATGRSYY